LKSPPAHTRLIPLLLPVRVLRAHAGEQWSARLRQIIGLARDREGPASVRVVVVDVPSGQVRALPSPPSQHTHPHTRTPAPAHPHPPTHSRIHMPTHNPAHPPTHEPTHPRTHPPTNPPTRPPTAASSVDVRPCLCSRQRLPVSSVPRLHSSPAPPPSPPSGQKYIMPGAEVPTQAGIEAFVAAFRSGATAGVPLKSVV
jgi:hypothetical protein